MFGHVRSMRQAVVGVLVAAIIGAFGSVTAGASLVQASQKPEHGGTVVIGGYTQATIDPDNPAWTQGGLALGVNIFGALFSPVATSGGNPSGVAPDLASAYSYDKGFKTLTITLRPKLTFQDGTPLNAQAVVADFARSEPAGSDTVSQYFSSVSSVTTKGLNVIVHFSSPDANFISALADTAAGLMTSPTAFASEGSAGFSLKPIGAGPFSVVSNQPAQELQLQRYPDYWDAKHVYIANVEYLNVGTVTQTELADLSSNVIQQLALTSTSAPAVVQQAFNLPNITAVKGPNLMVNFLQINTFVPPFNNQQAREAVDYCTDRNAINDNIDGGYSAPGWVFAGPAGLYYPKGGLKAAEKYQPYPYDPAKGEAIVQSLGGLSFTFVGGTGQTVLTLTALQQMWQACGMKVTVDSVAGAQQQADYASGNYQMVLGGSGGIANPDVSTDVGYLEYTSSLGHYGFNSTNVLNLLNETNHTLNPQLLYTIWQKIYMTVNQLAVAIPIVTAKNYFFQSSCLKGDVPLIAGVVMTNAYYVCTPT
jgi:peptide/nickel transport system substrate-binding protein